MSNNESNSNNIERVCDEKFCLWFAIVFMVIYLVLFPIAAYTTFWFLAYFLESKNHFIYGFLASGCFTLSLPFSIFFMWRFYYRKQLRKVFLIGLITLCLFVLTWISDYFFNLF